MLRALLKRMFAGRRGASRQRLDADPQALFQEGNRLQQMRRFDAAAQAYESAADGLSRRASPEPANLALVLNQWGLARLRAGAFGEAGPLLARAAELDPSNVSLGGCARFPALMSRSIPLERAPLGRKNSRRPVPLPGELMEIGYFFVGREDSPRHAEYCDLLSISMQSARRNAANCRITILTDEETAFPASVRPDELFRTTLEPQGLMLARLQATRAWLEFLQARGGAFLAMLCDPDTMIVQDPRTAYGMRFDVALVTRSDFVEARLDHEPFIAGVCFASGARPGAAAKFFALCEREFEGIADWGEVRGFYPRPIRDWRGDQIVPAAIVGWGPYMEWILSGRADRMQVEDVEIGFLPSDPYCFPYRSGLEDTVLAERTVLDFKGDRKRHMHALGLRLGAA